MRFFAREEKKKMEDWLSVNTYGENLHVTQGVLDGSINMVVSSIEMADACRELMYKYKDKIQKYAVTYQPDEIYREALERVEGSEVLRGYKHIIMQDWSEGDEH